MGKERDFRDKEFRQAIRSAVKLLNETGSYEAVLYLTEEKVKRREVAWRVEHAVAGGDGRRLPLRADEERADRGAPAAAQAHAVGAAALRPRRPARPPPRAVSRSRTAWTSRRISATCRATSARRAISAERAQELGKEFPDIKVTVLERPQIEALGMGSFLSVTNGSDEPPRFIVLEYEQAVKKQKPLVLVGKGITFDTGGISIKPAARHGPDEVRHVRRGVGARRVPRDRRAAFEAERRRARFPTCENMPSGRATKPGDIVKSMSGQTIEVLNTDAEGRLILADALTYAERYEPQAVVDIATLTGAMVVALGHVASGIFSNSDPLARALIAAGDDAYDRGWQMPLWDDYQEGLASNFADFANVAGRAGGSITAACFLSRFARKYDWAHLDIAGIAWKEGKDKGATGRPVPMLATWLLANESLV